VQIERVYMLLMIVYWAVQPNKGWLPNRIHAALAFFLLVVTAAWLGSPYAGLPVCQDVVENYYKIIVFYLLVVTSVRNPSDLRKLAMQSTTSGENVISDLRSILEDALDRVKSEIFGSGREADSAPADAAA